MLVFGVIHGALPLLYGKHIYSLHGLRPASGRILQLQHREKAASRVLVDFHSPPHPIGRHAAISKDNEKMSRARARVCVFVCESGCVRVRVTVCVCVCVNVCPVGDTLHIHTDKYVAFGWSRS
jgi:hypothetical protein